MLFGDYCMEPTDNLLKYFDGSDEYDLLNYYFRCAGSNPVEEYQTDILSFATDLEDALLTLLNEPSSPCHGNTHLETAINEIGPIFDNVGRIVSSMSCAPVQNAWIKVIETGFCSEIMDGVYPMWVVVYLTTAFIFLLNIISDVLSQYFEEHLWKLDPVNRVTQNEMAHSDPAQVGGTVEEGAKMDIVVGNNSSNANVEMTNL